MKVELPGSLDADTSNVGVGISRKVPVQQTDDGIRYIEVDGSKARTVMRQWEQSHDVSYPDSGRLSGGSWPDHSESEIPEYSVENAQDEHWQTVTTAIRNGDYDDVLDELAEVDSRESVIDAIRQRKSELV